jgi:hypothetical protein
MKYASGADGSARPKAIRRIPMMRGCSPRCRHDFRRSDAADGDRDAGLGSPRWWLAGRFWFAPAAPHTLALIRIFAGAMLNTHAVWCWTSKRSWDA